MNKQFAQYSTSVAFSVQLTKRQCNELLRLIEGAPSIWHGSSLTTRKALDSKGLVAWEYKDGKPHAFAGLTDAGKAMCALLKLAGITIENTETAVTLREAA